MKSILGTAAFLVAWSVLWFVNVVYLSTHISSCLTVDACQAPVIDDGPRDIAVWVIGLIVIVAVRVWMYRGRWR